MTKNIITLTAIIISVLISSCSGDEAKRWKIGISQCSSDDWRMEMNDEIHREMMSHDDAEVEIRSADDDSRRQIEDVRYFMDNDFDLIIVAPNDESVTPVVAEAYNKGIPVITFDRDVSGDKYTAHFEVDNYGLGKSAAEYALTLLPSKANIIEIQGTERMSPTQKRHKGFMDEISRYPDMKVVASEYADWNEALTVRLVDSLLTIYPDIDMIYAHNDRMAISASQTAGRRGRTGIRFLGIDGSANIGIKAVADSVIDATFLYPTEAGRLISTAMAILKGEKFNREELVAPLSPVDRSNADILLQQKALQKGEIEKIQLLRRELNDSLDRQTIQSALLYSTVALVILFCVICFMLLRAYWQHKNHQRELMSRNKQLEEQRDRQKELYQQLDNAMQEKLVFFTNVSHDLRTPLTLISEPIDQLIENDTLSEDQRGKMLMLANKNVKILKRLINQILDFRKIENGKMTAMLVEVDFVSLVKEWIESFSGIAKKRNIKLTSKFTVMAEMTVALDVEKMERVIFNLLSNAFKYTPDNGVILFSCSCDEESLRFSVKDTGCGISEADIGKVFERFYQVDKIHPNGSGIGLALTKAFIELHGGSITVASEYGKGATFTVDIPVRHVENRWSENAISITQKEIYAELDSDEINFGMREIDADKPTVLIVDDNRDIRELIGDILSPAYNVMTASNGKSGVKMAAKYIPDLIICDVMMPVMDGMECCRVVKNEVTTSHIPVLMLTAGALDEQRAQGYENGADGYLSKPFNGNVLKARCENLISNRKRIHDLYSNNTELHHREIAAGSDSSESSLTKEIPYDIDSEFYREFISVVNKEMGNPDLNIEQIAGKMGLGQSQFTRKIKSLTNYTPVEIIRNLRIRKSRQLLTTTEKSMSQIAYEVGFSSPAYFSKCFRDAYGESPTDLRTRLSAGK